MQFLGENVSLPLGLFLFVLLEFSHGAAIQGHDADNAVNSSPESQVSVEHELQALVKAGALGSPPGSLGGSHASRAISQARIDPADLARAASMVEEVEARARQGSLSQPQARSEPHTPTQPASQMIPGPAQPTVDDPLAGLELTPKAIAEYLLITGDFQGFEQALGDLLRADVVTAKEALSYKDAVGWQYEALLYKLVSTKAASLEEFMTSGTPTVKSNSINGDRPSLVMTKPGKAAAMLPPHKATPGGMNMHRKLRQLRMRALLEKEATLEELIDVINQQPEGPSRNMVSTGMKRAQDIKVKKSEGAAPAAPADGTKNVPASLEKDE